MPQRKLSNETKRLLEELGRPVSSIARLVRFGDTSARVVERVGASGEPAALPDLLPYVFDKRRSVARSAARAASLLLSAVPVSEFPWLDERLRGRSTWWQGWFNMKPADLRSLARFEDSYPALLRLATCHPSGYVREGALKSLGANVDGSELPFLLIRLNDWVKPVRSCALELVKERANPDHAASLVRCLPLVIRLSDLGRADHTEAVEMILEVFRSPESGEALLEGTKAPDLKIRRLAFRLAPENSTVDVGALVRIGLQDADQLVRLWGARLVVPTFSKDALPAVLETLESDSFMAIRRHALDVRMDQLPRTAEQKLVEFLLDRSVAVRGHCQYYVKKRFDRDPAAFYREYLKAGAPRLRECLLGLGEVGEAADAQTLELFLGDPSASIRAAAIRSIAKLSKDPPIEKIIQALQEESGGVSREAREALKGWGRRVSPDILDSIYSGAAQRHVRKNALLVVNRLGLWDGLPILLRASCDDDDKLRELGLGFLSRWLIRSNRGHVVPTKEQIQRAREVLDTCSSQMNEVQWSEFDFVLRSVAP